MSLNKFVNIDKTKPLNLDVACEKLEAELLKLNDLEITTRLSDNLYIGYGINIAGLNTTQDISLFPAPDYTGPRHHGSSELPPDTLFDGYALTFNFRGTLSALPSEVVTFKLYAGPTSSDLICIFLSPPLVNQMGNAYYYLRFDCQCYDGNKIRTTGRFISRDDNNNLVDFGNTVDATIDYSVLQNFNPVLKFTNASLFNQVFSLTQEISRTR